MSQLKYSIMRKAVPFCMFDFLTVCSGVVVGNIGDGTRESFGNS